MEGAAGFDRGRIPRNGGRRKSREALLRRGIDRSLLYLAERPAKASVRDTRRISSPLPPAFSAEARAPTATRAADGIRTRGRRLSSGPPYPRTTSVLLETRGTRSRS